MNLKSGVIRGITLTSAIFLLMSCSSPGGCGSLFKGSKLGVPVTVQNVEVRLSSPVVTVSGALIPSDRNDIALPNKAKIDKVFVHVGDAVNIGTPLFKISEEDIGSQLVSLRTERREVEAILEKNNYLLKNRDKLVEEGKADQSQYSGLEKDISANEATLERIKYDIAALEAGFEKLTVLSPSTGIIIKKDIGDGSFVSPNQVLLSIINTDPILVSFPLTADESAGIQTGTPVEVNIDELGGEKYTATVTYVAPELHQAGKTFDVWASIPNPDRILKAGMRATATFRSTRQHKVFAIPTSALIQRDHQINVFVVKNGLASETKITPKEMTKDHVIVLDGLSEGDLVVVKGGNDLQDGSPVDIWR